MPHKDPVARRAYDRLYRAKARARINARWLAWKARNYEARRFADMEGAARRRKARRGVFLASQGGVCCYCGTALTVETLTVDHITPTTAGGGDEAGNLAAACFDCNRDKGDRTPEEWQPDREFPGLPGNGNGGGGHERF